MRVNEMNTEPPSHTMNDHHDSQFSIISDFLNAFAPEVSGRSSDTLTPELRNKLISMAAGKLDEQECRDISRDILANENAMKTLAELLNKN